MARCKALELTVAAGPERLPKLKIDRIGAAGDGEEATTPDAIAGDPASSASPGDGRSIFEQAWVQLSAVPAWRYCQSSDSPHLAFEVELTTERAQGKGGPYRAFFSDIAREVTERSTIRLFAPTANHSGQRGEGRDKVLPRAGPAGLSVGYLRHMEFLGVLVGAALRTRTFMPLALPSLVLKPLVAQPLTLEDLEAVDTDKVTGVILPLLQCTTQESFDQMFKGQLTWSTVLADGTTVELRRHGRRLPLLFGERDLYLQQMLELHLGQAQRQVEALARGLAKVVPAPLLQLYTWAELETQVCGEARVDVQMLRRHTEYSGTGPDAAHIVHFWSVLSEFTEAERCKFVKFAWGQERLPATDEEFEAYPRIRMLIKASTVRGDPDQFFPTADTCFFNVTIPAYSSKEVMQQKLSTVVHMEAWGIDGDDVQLEEN